MLSEKLGARAHMAQTGFVIKPGSSMNRTCEHNCI